MAKKLDACRSGNDFVRYARNRGAQVSNGKGSHMKVSTGKGTCVVPVHNGDLGTGIRCKIIKLFMAIGLGAIVIGLVLTGV
jgi:predicted RNA binding protein YcfA (HicA-like mRNA interferase family)